MLEKRAGSTAKAPAEESPHLNTTPSIVLTTSSHPQSTSRSGSERFLSEPAAHPRSASVGPSQQQPSSGLISIRFFSADFTPTLSTAPSPLLSPAIGAPPSGGGAAAELFGVIRKKPSWDMSSVSQYGPPVAKGRKGRGRPRTKSMETGQAAEQHHDIHRARPASVHSICMAPPMMMQTINAHELMKLPRIAPRPPSTQQQQTNQQQQASLFGIMQPNSMMQARTLMARQPSMQHVSYGYPMIIPNFTQMRAGLTGSGSGTSSMMALPSPSLTATSSQRPSPEMDVLRLISDACEIHEDGQRRASQPVEPRAIRTRTLQKREKKIAPRQGKIALLPKRQSSLPTGTAELPRKILPRPPTDKIALPSLRPNK